MLNKITKVLVLAFSCISLTSCLVAERAYTHARLVEIRMPVDEYFYFTAYGDKIEHKANMNYLTNEMLQYRTGKQVNIKYREDDKDYTTNFYEVYVEK